MEKKKKRRLKSKRSRDERQRRKYENVMDSGMESDDTDDNPAERARRAEFEASWRRLVEEAEEMRSSPECS